eukprot:jgi/Phyca11/122428/e_gw1.48.386.1
MLLGRKTRIDQTIAGLLQHQMTITQQIVSEIGQLHSTTRRPKSCDDVNWKCTCLFSTSNHLPCRHLMHVAHKGHGFKMLPVMTISERWSTLTALKSTEEFEA